MVKHKRLLGMSALRAGGGATAIPLGKANDRSAPGTDVTVVAYGRMVNEAIAAAETLAARGHRVRGDRPPHAAAARHRHRSSSRARKTNRVVVVHEAVRFGGLGGRDRRPDPRGGVRPPRRAGRPRSARRSRRCRSARCSKQHYVPNAERIAAGIRDVGARCSSTARGGPELRSTTAGVGTASVASLVGIVVNPLAGKDIRRLVRNASPISDAAKVGIVQAGRRRRRWKPAHDPVQ